MSVSTDLALDIVLEEFGPTCHSVAEALTVLGPSAIPDIVKYVSSLPNYASVEESITARVCIGEKLSLCVSGHNNLSLRM